MAHDAEVEISLVELRLRNPFWRDNARCQGADIEGYVSMNIAPANQKVTRIEAAQRLCAGCVVKGDCALDAWIHRDTHLVRAGIALHQAGDKSPKDRYLLLEVALREFRDGMETRCGVGIPIDWATMQPICTQCAAQRRARILIQQRQPEVDKQQCVDCGKGTIEGLFIRIDPSTARYPTIERPK